MVVSPISCPSLGRIHHDIDHNHHDRDHHDDGYYDHDHGDEHGQGDFYDYCKNYDHDDFSKSNSDY